MEDRIKELEAENEKLKNILQVREVFIHLW
jgi:hypothetical protein